jgi:ribosomal protein RSM22 (predicted rRNA methylase)
MDTSKELSPQEMKTLAADVTRLSRLLTRDRANLPAAYLADAGLRKAYQAYFLPTNLQKIQVPLKELAVHPGKPLDKGKLHVLDLGAGPGTALLGVLEFFGAREKKPGLMCVAVDHVKENLRIAEDLFESHRKAQALIATLRTERSRVQDAVHQLTGTFDLIILSNVLNELFHGEGRKIEKRLVIMEDIMNRLLADDGSCIIIEPALRETSREMLEVRDGLLKLGFTIYAPCFFNKECPALTNPKDWCHEDIAWDPPALITELDKLTGLRKDSLKFSYLVLRKDGVSQIDQHLFRIVSEPLVSKGKREFFICGAEGRKLVTRLDKDATSSNECFENLKRGDSIRTERMVDEGKRFKVTKDTKISLALRD